MRQRNGGTKLREHSTELDEYEMAALAEDDDADDGSAPPDSPPIARFKTPKSGPPRVLEVLNVEVMQLYNLDPLNSCFHADFILCCSFVGGANDVRPALCPLHPHARWVHPRLAGAPTLLVRIAARACVAARPQPTQRRISF